MRIINFQSGDYHSSPLLMKLNLLKFEKKILLANVLLASNYNNPFRLVFEITQSFVLIFKL